MEYGAYEEPSHWFPSNHPGYELFPTGAPDVNDLRVNKVSTKALDLDSLQETREKLKPYLTEAAGTWWDTTLARLRDREAASCETCSTLREEQKKNCITKKDDDPTKKEKRRRANEAEKAFLEHVQDETLLDNHPAYPRSSLFPPARFSWINGGYLDSQPESVELTQDEANLVGAVRGYRDECEDHFVGITARANRAGGKHARRTTIKPGDIVIVNADEKTGYPFYVGEVLSCDNTEEGNFDAPDSELQICEYGCPGGLKSVDPADVKWQAIFRGLELVRGELVQRDEFKLQASSRPSKSVFHPLRREIWMSHVAEFDAPEKMLTAPPKRRAGTGSRKLQAWVKTVLHNNPRVRWEKPQRPNVPGPVEKRARDTVTTET